MKALIFDSGPLINFSINGFLPILEKLHEEFDGKFFITDYVKQEVYERPLHIQQFELGAVRMHDLIERGILEDPKSVGITSEIIREGTQKFMEQANHSMRTEGNWVQLVSDAEMSCFALAQELKKKGVEVMIAIDERTARMLSEKPENLAKLMSLHLHKSVQLAGDVSAFQGFNIIRSSELIYVAHKKKLTHLDDSKALEALLYATKYKGSAISWEEIDLLKRI